MAENQWILPWALAVLVLLLIGIYLWRYFFKPDSEKIFSRTIRQISKYVLHNVVIPDAVEGSSYIDWLVLTPRGILVLSQKPYSGMIFAAENISQWTQVVGRRSYSFDNPLQQLEVDVVTIKSLIPNAPVKGYVVFDQDSYFPKGKPNKALTLKEVKQNISVLKEGAISPELKEFWDKLCSVLKEAKKPSVTAEVGVDANTQAVK